MKNTVLKSVLALVMVFIVLPMMSQNYLKIYFKDGHTERHFMHLVNNIAMTKYDLEGNLHSDYQMQQIVMPDTTYSYYLADIDSMTFRKVDEEMLKSRLTSVQSSLESIFQKCSSLEDLASHIDEIRSIEGIEYAYSEGKDLVIQILDWFEICIDHQPMPSNIVSFPNSMPEKRIKRFMPKTHEKSQLTATIGFQMDKDKTWSDAKGIIEDLCEYFEYMGYQPKLYIGEELDFDFYYSHIFDSNLLLIDTHGGRGFFNKKHFLYTGIETDNLWSSAVGLEVLQKLGINIGNFDIDDIGITCCEHSEGGFILGVKWYWMVKEDYIRKSPYKFTGSGPHIVFVGACSSLEGDDILTRSDNVQPYGSDSFAKVFFDKGADVYLGYNRGVARATGAAASFFDYMMHGASVEQAFKKLHPLYKYESDSDEKALLVDLYKKDTESKSLFIVNTKTVEKTEQDFYNEYKNAGQLVFEGETTISEKDKGGDYGFMSYGFKIATQPKIDNWENCETIPSYNTQYIDTQRGEFTFSAIYTPTQGGTYYYRAFTYDGIHYNWGEERSFTLTQLAVSTSSVSLNVGWTRTVDITSGSGSYSIEKIEPSGIVTASISGNTVSIDALSTGSAKITIKDTKSGETATIEVTVTGGSPSSDGDIVMERKYYVDSRGDVSTSWEGGKSNNYAYQQISLSFDNNKRLSISYLNTYYWDDSRKTQRKGVYIISYDGGKKVKEWYIQPRKDKEWIKEKIVVSKDGKVSYFSNDDFMGEETFESLSLDGAKNVTVDLDPYGWWYTHYHYMDDFVITTPATVVKDDFNDGVLDLNIWQSPANPAGVREENGILKAEQIRTDQDYHLKSKPIPLVGGDSGTEPVSYLTCPDDHHPHMIDLGLPSGTKWACCNVDASKPEDYGGYYAWGETEQKNYYSEDTHKYFQNGNYVDIGSDISGTSYDVAHVKWGGNWQMPSLNSIKELLDNCKLEETECNGVSGQKFTGSNGASIFLPFAGMRWNDNLSDAGDSGSYWLSTLIPSIPECAYGLLSYYNNAWWDGSYCYRYYGRTVRPVQQGEFDERLSIVVPEDIRKKMEKYMPIYDGKNPPIVEGVFKIKPYQCVFCEDGGFAPGYNYGTNIMKFSNFDTTNNTFDYEHYFQGKNEFGSGLGAFISGDGNHFTAYFLMEGEDNGIYTKTAELISGEVTSEGLKNVYSAFVMLDKGNDPSNKVMKKGYFRVYKDGDGFSEPCNWEK